jgi:predicted ATPase
MKAYLAKHYLLQVRLMRERIQSFDEYPFVLPEVRHLDSIEMHPAVTFLIGENGSGKSTLLEAIAIATGFNPEGGTRNFNFATRASHSDLHRYLRLVRSPGRPKDGFFQHAESYFNVATQIETLDAEPSFGPPLIGAYGGKSLHEQSHGESFMALILERFRGKGLYFLDEPEAALSPSRQLALLSRLHDLVEDASQFVIATHSPIVMAYPHARILHLSEAGIAEVAYRDTEHFRVTRRFLADPARMLKILMES